ncbi:hypothetical protein OJF2_24930 [Aquisphaera giovannonii]|uniref:Bacterial type II secretion system protein G n=1 Tax=Aquisphaera giovannonii TaxID=406548 RepID=A0A5B9W1V4_9BACT|nr:hypothetical protein [Aquisphaera giovannonii]QEH33960.1 hypothetical protein OJF2_24930 [Aquisphaera giovannonii]
MPEVLAKAAVMLGVAAGAIFIAGSFMCESEPVRGPTGGPGLRDEFELESLKAAAKPLVERLYQIRRSEGYFPASLAYLGLKRPQSRFGRWRYHVHDGGQAFALTNGDYMKNGFVLCWSSEHGDWWVDR